MFHFLKRLTRTLQPASRNARRSERFRPTLERFEERVTPVNDIQTTFAAGTLTINTVDQFDEVSVLAGDNDQNFQILANGPGSVILHKNGATKINGGVVDVPFTGVVNMVLNLKVGDEFVVCKAGVDIPGNVTFNGGDGNNTFNLDGDVAGTTKFNNVTITNGDGVDNIAFLEGTFILSGSVTINTGDGGSNMNIGFQAADDVTINGPISITSGAGPDNVNFNGSDFIAKSPITIKGGSGDNSVRFAYQETLQVTKALSVTNGTGDDVFEVSNTNKTSSFAGITVNHGIGNNRVTFDSKTSDTITGNLIVLNGSGDDKIEVDSADFTVTGLVQFSNGSGDNVTDISPANTNTIGGDFTLTNLAGKDTTTIAGVTVNYKGVTITNGNGDSNTQLTGSSLSFSSISSASLDGTDTFGVTVTSKFEVLVGGLTIKNGNGGSAITLAATVPATAAIKGALSITNGDGVDTTIIGNGAGNFNGLHAVTISNGAGNSTTTFNPTQLNTGSITVTNGDGFDQVKIGDGVLQTFGIAGSLKISNLTGGSNTFLNPLSAGAIAGAFTVNAADDNDKVDVIRTTVSGATTLTLGAGNDEVELDNFIMAALTINTGAGNDIIEIELNTNDGIGSTFVGAVSVKTGNGDDTMEVGLDANDKVTASAAITLDGGLGLDSFDQNAATNTFAFVPSLLGLEVQLP